MKLRLSDRFGPQDGGVFVPGDPLPPTISTSDLFEVELFEAADNPGLPMRENTLSWRVVAKDASTNMDDYEFRMTVFGHFTLWPVEPEGTTSFRQNRDTLALLWVRKGGGSWVSFDTAVTLPLDKSACVDVEILGLLLQGTVFEQINRILNAEDTLRYRRVVVPKDPNQPNNGLKKTVQLEPSVDWSVQRVKFTLPLEIVLDNFFNGDLDVTMEVRFDVDVTGPESAVDVQVSFTADTNFSGGEDVLSLGHTATIAAVLDRMIPPLLKCKSPRIEAEILRGLLNLEVRSVVDDMPGGDIFKVSIVDGGDDEWRHAIRVTICPRAVEEDGGVIEPGPVIGGATPITAE